MAVNNELCPTLRKRSLVQSVRVETRRVLPKLRAGPSHQVAQACERNISRDFEPKFQDCRDRRKPRSHKIYRQKLVHHFVPNLLDLVGQLSATSIGNQRIHPNRYYGKRTDIVDLFEPRFARCRELPSDSFSDLNAKLI